MKPGTMTAAQVHKQYSEAVTAFRRWIPDPTLRQAFNREADSFFQHCALGVWQADNAQAITPKHVEFYNAIYSGKNLSPSALYWEVASGVANYDLFQPPAFFQALRDYDRRKGTTLARRFADQTTLILLLFAAVDDVVSEAEAGFVNSCSDILLELCGKDGLSGDRPALKADEFITRRPAPPQEAPKEEAKADQGAEETAPPAEPEPTLEELAKETGVDKEEIVQAMEAGGEVESLYRPIHQKEGSEIRLLDRIEERERREDKILDTMVLKQLLETLDAKERQLIYLRYFADRTQSDVGKIMGISQVQVSRMEKRIIENLRRKSS